MRPSAIHFAVALAMAFPGFVMARGSGGGGLLAWGALWLFCITLTFLYKWVLPLLTPPAFLGAGIYGMTQSKDTVYFVCSALMALIGGALLFFMLFHRDR